MIETTERDRVLVTGTSRGLGAATASLLLGRGFEVVGVSRKGGRPANGGSEARIRTVAAELGTDEGREAVVGSVTDGEPLRGLVLNAGVSMRADFEVADAAGLDPIRHQVEQDLVAPLLLLRDLLRAEALGPNASIVFVSSNLAGRGLAGKTAYAAAKAGLEGACRCLAHELGPRGLRVNAVAPGLLRTDMTADLGDAGFDRVAAETPLGRVGDVEDVARVIAFVLSNDARHMTGQTLVVDGGWGA